jgi:hypothetical protein
VAYKVVCDHISIYGFFVNIKNFRKADEIVLYKAEESLFDKLWITFFRFMNAIFLRKQVAIKAINKYLYFSLNPKVVEVIERNAEKINVGLVSGINRFLNGEEKDVVKYVKHNLIGILQKKLFIRMQIEKDNHNNKYFIITDKNNLDIYNGLCDVFEDGFLLRNRLFMYVFNLFLTIFMFFKILSQFKLRYKIKEKFYTDLLVMATYFGYDGGFKNEFLSEDYVFDKKRVSLLITNVWRPASSKETKEYMQKLNEKEIKCIDAKGFCIDFRGLFTLIKGLRKYVIVVNPDYGSWRDVYTYFLSLYHFLLETIYLQNYSCKAILCFDDYMEWHIARTLIYRQYGIKTIGIQHSTGNGMYGTPSAAYVCFDKYLVWGNFYKELFTPFWDDVDTVKFSYNRIDKFLRRWNKEDINYSNLYSIISKSKKKNILILLPQVAVLNQQRLPNSKGLIDFLKNLDGLLVNSGNYFIRPKTNYKIEEFQQLIKNEHVNFVLSDKCSTSELISMVDLVVAPAGSGAVCECSLLRKKVIGYDYFGRYLSKYWIRYGKDACLDNVDDLKNVLLKYLTNETVEVNWEKLWDEVVYPNNGNTNQIIEGMI